MSERGEEEEEEEEDGRPNPDVPAPPSRNAKLSMLSTIEPNRTTPAEETPTVYHSFVAIPKGRGFKTIEYRSTQNKPVNHFTEDPNVLLPVQTRHGTLTGIRKDFGNAPNIFACVVEGHLTAPTTLIQLVVECPSKEGADALKDHYSKKPDTLCVSYHVDYEWLSDVPKDIVKMWNSL